MKYKVNDLVTMRSPLHHSDSFFTFEDISKNKSYINDFLQLNLEFREAIAVSNSSLTKIIDDGKIGSKQQETIIKYFIRSIVRCAPFGLLSGISCCKFGNQTNIQRKSGGKFKKYCTVDFEWFYGVVKLLEKDKNILYNTSIKFNDQCYKCGDRLINPYTSNYGQAYVDDSEEKTLRSRIRYSKQIDFIINEASEWITYKDFLTKLYAFNKDVEMDILEKFVNQLIDNEYLITDLRVPLSNIDPLEQVLTKLKKVSYNKEESKIYYNLDNINNLRKEYIKDELGKGIENYSNLCNEMSKVYKVKNYLSTISQVDMNLNHIGNNIKNEINSFLDFLIAYSTEDNETPYIYKFKRKFVENYGEYREIPLLNLLDGTIGIGSPYLELPEVNIESNKRKIIKKYISDKVILAIKNGEKEIQLNKEDYMFFKNIEKNKLNYSNSFELNIKILAKDNESIDNNEFKIFLAPCCGSNRVGKLVNRFYNLLDEDSQFNLNELYKFIERNEDFLIADTSYLPKRARNNNICNGNDNYKYSVNCGLEAVNEDKSIDLSDIVVGYNPNIDRLYIKSKKYNQIINAVSDSMLNRTADNHLIRFMWEVSYAYEIHPIEQMLAEINHDFKYMPAISYGKVTIIPETWKIDSSDFINLDSFTEFKKQFDKFKIKWKVPTFIYFLIHDRYMYVDINNPICMKYFYQEVKRSLKNKQSVIIQECESPEQLWLSDNNGNKYHSEFVLECLSTTNNKFNINSINDFKKCKFTKSNISYNLNNIYTSDNDRDYLPAGNEWLYFKIYLETNKSIDFILQEMAPFIDKLYKSDLISNFFFIRYRDPDFHLRFRVKIKEKNKKIHILNLIIDWLKVNYENQSLKKFIMDTYSRETERYGGNDSIEYAEDIFKWDSLIAIKILEIKDDEFDLDLISFICVFSFINNIFDDTNIAEEFLNNYIQREYHNEFRKEKEKYVEAIKKYDLLIKNSELLTIFRNREKSIKKFIDVINSIDENKELMNTKSEIIMALMHMLCNRLNGDRTWERKILCYIRHSLHVYNEQKKHLQTSSYN